MPALLGRASEGTVVWLYRLRRAAAYDQTGSGGGVALSYSPPWWIPSRLRSVRVRRKVRRFFYSGQLLDGRPHGFGEWRDDASGGECMRGFWHEGRPVAPFRSRLTKTGYAFEAIHVAFVTARAEPLCAMARQPRRHGYGGLRVGLVAIECSVSGEFFSALPRCLLLRETAATDLEATAAARAAADEPGARDGRDGPRPQRLQHDQLEAAPGENDDADVTPLALCARARAHNARELSTCLALLRHSDEALPLHTLSVSLAADGCALQLAGFFPTCKGGAREVTITLEASELREEPAGGQQQLREEALAALDAAPAEEQAQRSILGVRFMPPAAGAGEASRAPLSPSRDRRGASSRLPPSGALAAAPQLAPRLAVHGWRPTSGRRAVAGVGRAEEVLIYIHGFSCSTSEALKRIGQLFALGRFPPHIKPLCFSWPTGASFLDYAAAARMAASAELAHDLRACLRAVRDSGVRDVHFFTHSMGAAVLTNALPLIRDEFEPLLPAPPADGAASGTTGSDGSDDGAEKLRMVSVTLANPELFEDEFWTGPFPRLCALCAQVTIYGDEADGALFWSELLNRKQAVGRLQRAPYPLALANGEAVARGHVLAAPAPQTDGGAWADVDCIDCTWLESNVHAIRHNSFGLNRMMVDDIRECIVDRRRAAQRRSRLVRKIGNVFSFLQPPPHVVNH
jgi:hypothetical protein